MNPERWQQIKNLVNSALEQSAEQRAAVLQQSCAEDISLRRGAEALLSFHEQATRNLANSPAKLSSAGTMSPERWQQVEQVFQSALELSPAERPAFLAKACGDDVELREEVEALLVFQTGMSGVIQGAVHEAAGLLANESQKARFTPGTTLNKRYRIIGQLGKGGMGEVYRADDLKLGHPVALKFLTEKLSNDKAMLARFHSEVAMAHRVTHPNVCRVHDIGEVTTSSGKLHFLSMEYVDGEDLSSLLRRIGRLPADKAVEIANQLCAGIAAAHEAGVLHRDLKPANVMLDGKGRVRITDFGLAGFAEQIREQEVFAGTPAYMSPEQFAGKEVTTKSDIYALGLVLYEIFTGKRVFEAGSLAELQKMHESSSPTNPSNWVKDIDPLVERVILRCLEKDPGRRLASAKQVADALPGGDPLAAALALGETPSPEMVAAAGSKTGMKPLYAVACLLAIIVGLVISAMLSHRQSLIEQTGFTEPSEVMVSKARAVVAQLGYPELPVDRAHGLRYDRAYLEYLEKRGATEDRKQLLATGRTPAIYFWYRESQSPLNPVIRWDADSVTPTDPPENVPGMRSLALDPAGRLLRFGALTPQVEKNPATMVVPDWKLPFALAGLDFSRFTPAEPEWSPDPLGPCDVRVAWTGYDPDLPEVPIRIEAAGYHGRLVSFQLLRPYHKSSRMPSDRPTDEKAPGLLSLVIFLATIITSVWLAGKNVRDGRADVRGSLRLGIAVFILGLLCNLLLTHHLPILLHIDSVALRMGEALIHVALVALTYLALEPFVRRKWPRIVISWNRVLTGGWRDPLVGRDLLAGLMVGILVTLNHKVSVAVSQWLGHSPNTDVNLETLLNGRFVILWLAFSLQYALTIGFMICFTIFLFRLVLRRDWLTLAAFALLAACWAYVTGPVFFVLAGVLSSLVLVFALTKFGLLSMVVAMFANTLLTWFLITTNLSIWFASGGLIAASVLLALAIFAFHTSLGGQKVFAGKLLEE